MTDWQTAFLNEILDLCENNKDIICEKSAEHLLIGYMEDFKRDWENFKNPKIERDYSGEEILFSCAIQVQKEGNWLI